MDQVTTGTGPVPEDEELERFGYRQQFVRSLRHFESFAVAFLLTWAPPVLLYVFTSRRRGTHEQEGTRHGPFGRYEARWVNVLALDQGTSTTKALLVGPGGEVLGRGEVPLSPAIVWQDRRSAAVCARLAGRAAGLSAISGLPLDPYFAAPKMTWLRENMDLPSGDVVLTTTDTWLLARLGGAYVTDAATASRTMLLDLDAVAWSEVACAAFGLSPAALPAEGCLDGQVYTAGSAVRWLAGIGVLGGPAELDAVGETVPDAGGRCGAVPAWWRPGRRGCG